MNLKLFFCKFARFFFRRCGQPEQSNPSYTRARHRHHLENCVTSLDEFLEFVKCRQDEERVVIGAESLRKATRHLGLITGLVTTEEILSNIFQKFCVGK